MLGWKTVCAVEWEPYPASVLCARQNDKILAPFPIWDDVCTFDGKPWRGIVDVVSGGFPCQDISTAGGGAGISGSRSGLWSEMARIIGEVRPRYAFVENSPMLTSRGLGTVLGDLAAMGFDARWGVISAADVGAPHLRERIWIVAHNNSESQSTKPIHAEQVCKFHMADADQQHRRGKSQQSDNNFGKKIYDEFSGGGSEMADAKIERLQGGGAENHTERREIKNGSTFFQCGIARKWPIEPDVGRVANGVAARVDRLKAIGNGQVPRVAATAFKLMEAT